MANLINCIRTVINNPNSAFFYTPPIYNEAKSFLLTNPYIITACNSRNELDKFLNLIDRGYDSRDYGYITLPYETGLLFEEKLEQFYQPTERNLCQAAFFEKTNAMIFDSSDFDYSGIIEILKKDNGTRNKVTLDISESEYISKIERIKKYIYEGDTYQVNFTIRAEIELNEELENLFARMIFSQSAEYIAIINNGNNIIMSFSPELFFEIKGDDIVTKPMKGTIKRGITLDEDQGNIEFLASNEKDKAENVMIVDLLRNDLGRISNFGSVIPEKLFEVEKYESLHQMISTISAKVNVHKFSEILRQIFPSGSITGAPKIRTMEIIEELENSPRGIYTGSIGLLTPEKIVLNVAIRTLQINKEMNRAVMGLGSGIVWDSEAKKEYNEVKLKGDFFTKETEYFELFETMFLENNQIFLLDEHLERLKVSADFFLFNFNKQEINKYLELLISQSDPEKKYRLKLQLNKWGRFYVDINEFNNDNRIFKIKFSEKKINKINRFLYHKTSLRELYQSELNLAQSEGFDEVVFINDDGFVTEGSFTNIFIRKNGIIFTPEINCGLLNGCFRKKYIIDNNVCEKKLTINNIINADEIFLTNSLRKVIKVNQLKCS